MTQNDDDDDSKEYEIDGDEDDLDLSLIEDVDAEQVSEEVDESDIDSLDEEDMNNLVGSIISNEENTEEEELIEGGINLSVDSVETSQGDGLETRRDANKSDREVRQIRESNNTQIVNAPRLKSLSSSEFRLASEKDLEEISADVLWVPDQVEGSQRPLQPSNRHGGRLKPLVSLTQI